MEWTLTDGTKIIKATYCSCGLTGGCPLCQPCIIPPTNVKYTIPSFQIIYKCPFCGADEKRDAGSRAAYFCDSYYTGAVGNAILIRDNKCYESKIANLKERLEAWRSLGANFVQEAEDEYSVIGWLRKDNIQRLKDLGEI